MFHELVSLESLLAVCIAFGPQEMVAASPSKENGGIGLAVTEPSEAAGRGNCVAPLKSAQGSVYRDDWLEPWTEDLDGVRLCGAERPRWLLPAAEGMVALCREGQSELLVPAPHVAGRKTCQ